MGGPPNRRPSFITARSICLVFGVRAPLDSELFLKRAVALALLVLGLTAAAQIALFALSGSVALLADVIHNAGDAATAIPLGLAFALRSARAERWAGLAVVLAIVVSACVAGDEAVHRLIEPADVTNLGALAAAGALGFAGTGSPRSSAPAPASGSTAPR